MTAAKLPLDEILALSGRALALFDADARLLAASPPFRNLFARLEPFLEPGTDWPLFLGEARRHGALSPETAHRLAMLEERLGDAEGPARDLAGRLGGDAATFTLSATSDGGFALAIDSGPEETGGESEIEEVMSKVLEACPTCLTMARIGDGHILYRSPEATALLGKGFDSRAHFVRREERADFITALLPEARIDDMRFAARHADGHSFTASISARLIEYRGEDVIVSSITDLTDEIALEKEIARQRALVFRAEKMSALGEVLAGVSHELNNPLSVVVGMSHMLLEDIDGPNRRRVEKLTAAAERCVAIVRAFLSMARERPLVLEEIAVADLMRGVEDAFEATTTGDAALSVEIEEGLPPLRLDEVQISQVLSNLLRNAEQAMEGTGGTVTIAVGKGAGPGRVVFRVTDTGPGIAPEIAGQIFDPLFTTKAAGKGTGIGLALCHRLVAAHGGSIELDEFHRDGACFVLDLPAVPPAQEPPQEAGGQR